MTIADQAVHEAKRILSRFGLATLPVPVEAVARQLGVTVQRLPLDDELSGMSFVKEGVSVIVVNLAHHPNRQRFTIAHELGHHVLHKDYLQNNVHVDKVVLHRNQRSSEGSDLKEIQANAFAAELLMPSNKMSTYKDLDINDDAQLLAAARRFKVSASALAFRVLNLG